ncbi:uncharacterized protein LOC132720630 isoform X2 [Ruditapes philippinarum]|uniref:uncharacterized protein LOC132720630 isoform X2 n=1 Tax=Ruditapes philippinarum TaxID=129788 RepID=UPI00295A99AE|nr:uncharacterized protein LOC132720630 isoform X2 [Ruditapes philippinarum]
MDFSLKNSLITVICLAVLVQFVRGGCREQIMQDANALQCFMNIGTYMTEAGTGGPNISSVDGIAQLICSPKGKEAFGCVLKYVKQCPEFLTSAGATGNPLGVLGEIPGFDVQSFLSDGFDGFCSMISGPCSAVSKCFAAPQTGNTRGIVKRGVPNSNNYYLTFQESAVLACGSMREQMTCMLNALEACPKSYVDKAQEQIENALKASMSSPYGAVTFEDAKGFIMNECPKMPKADTCVKDVFVSKEFVDCNGEAAAKYAETRTCKEYDLNKECVTTTYQPKCGKEIAEFLVRNTHVIFPGVPDDCGNKGNSGSVISTSFGLLLFISSLFNIL